MADVHLAHVYIKRCRLYNDENDTTVNTDLHLHNKG